MAHHHGMQHPPDLDAALDRLVPRPDLGIHRWRHPVVVRAIYAPSVDQALTATAPGQRVLDVGAGAGTVARELARAGRVVTAIDADPAACSAARRTLAGTDATVVEGAFGPDAGFAPASFDAIRFGRMLHHATDVPAVLDVAHALLVPHGVVIVEEFAPERIDERIAGWLVDRCAALAADGVALDDPVADAAAFVRDWTAKIGRAGLVPAADVAAAIAERFAVSAPAWEAGIWPDVAKRIRDADAAAVWTPRLAADEAAGVAAGALPPVVLRLEGRRG